MAVVGAILGLCFCRQELYLISLLPLGYYLLVLSQDLSIKKAIQNQFFFSMGVHLIGLSFLWALYPFEFLELQKGIAFVLLLLGWILLSFLLSVFYLIIPFVTQCYNLKQWQRGIVIILLWGLVEYGLEWIGFPWFRLGIFTLIHPCFSQIASFGGVYLCTVLWLSLAWLLVECITQYSSIKLIGIVALLITWCGSSMLLMSKQEVQNTYSVALIQGNISSNEKWSEEDFTSNEEVHLELIKQVSESTEAIFMAETVFTNTFYKDSELYEKIVSLPVFYGTFHSIENATYNALCSTLNNECYAKRVLVPFGEYMPRWALNLLPFLYNFQLAGSINQGVDDMVLEGEIGSVSPLLCFESIFPSLVNPYGDFLYIASNDSWFDGSHEQFQHLQHARMRSIENGIDGVRVGNTGITCLIDASGKVLQRIPSYEAGVLEGEIHTYTSKSMFRTFPWICFIGAILSLFLVVGIAWGKRDKGKWLEFKLLFYRNN